ncbi:hypothetical protein BKA70DRAFT_1437284 [Coprinopsis sp. MPI-PUGE-AT-0042]|nr:hypothetical protein BKA70DRAFT_1437284 [Coprinopsis sp. MPI-PUGE-AT-0042]
MPTKKTSTTSSMKRQTLGKAVPDNGRAAMKRMSGTPSPTSEATPFGDQTNGSTSHRAVGTQPHACLGQPSPVTLTSRPSWLTYKRSPTN